jgi:TolB protein
MDLEPQYDLIDEEYEVRHWPARWLAAILLLAMLCGVISTPLALFYLWYSSRNQPQERPVPTLAPVVEEQELGSTSRIAYIDLDNQLATIDPDGHNQRQLTQEDVVFRFPAWSPDGRQLAVLGGDSLYVIADQPQGSLRMIYQDEEARPFYLYWSPDSRQVSFLASHPEDGIALHLAQAGDQPASRLLLTGQPLYWDWLPGGQQLFFHAGLPAEEARLALFDLVAGTAEDNVAEPGFFQAPAVSRSGRYWAYAELTETGERLVVVKDTVNGGRTVAEPHLGQAAMSWSPAEDLLAYTSPGVEAPAFYGPLRLLDAVTGQGRTLSSALIVAYFWSPDGRMIAYFTVSDSEEGGIQAGTPRTAAKGRRQMNEIRLELWIVDVIDGSPRRILNFTPTDLFVFQFLPYFDQYALSHRLWSPTSDALVIPAVASGQPQILVVALEGFSPVALANGSLAFWSR